jgi:gliding motility-associated-like protein
MKKQILLALFFSFTYLGLNAQCNLPFPPSLDCASAPVICDLDGYCTTSQGPNATDDPTTFCGSVQNNQWFAFVAGSTSIELDFIVTTCTGTGQGTGLQAQVYSECGAPWTAASNCLYEISPNSTATLILPNLIIGNVYYLMTDGFSGDLCDYIIEVALGSTTPPSPDPAGPISGDPEFCPGASSVTYCADPSFGAAFYEWTVPAGAVIVGADNGECITIDFSGYTGAIGSTGEITATPTNGCESGGFSLFTVTQGPSPTGPDQSFILCPGETATYGNTVYSTATNGTPFVNTDIANAQGCLIETLVYVEIGENVTTDLVEVICQGDMSSTGETSTGTFVYNLLTNYYGCDSTVTLNLTVLDPQTQIFPVADEIDCSLAPVTVEAVVTNSDPSITYIWSGPCFSFPGFPGTPIIEVSCGGVYTLYAQQTVGGVTCISPTFSVTVNENTTPPTADPGFGGVIDCVSDSFTLGGTGSSNTSTYAYSWVGGTTGFSSSLQFPEVVEPGTYCFFMIDLATFCISSTECATVTGDNTPPVAVASASNNLDCNDLTATLDPSGSDAGTYTWSGTGSPSGPDPTVNMPGTYTLTVSSSNGCTATQEVTITQDIAAPSANIAAPSTIDCDNSTVSLDGSGSSGGVTYLWSTGETTSTATTNMGADTYTLTVTNTSNGCTDEVSVIVDDNSTLVTADVDIQGQITCAIGSVTLSAINIVGSSDPSYLWMPGGQTTPTIMVSAAGSVTLTVTDINTGCIGDVIVDVTSDTAAPTAVAGVSGNLNCTNTSVVLSTAGSSTGGNITAAWIDAGGVTVDPNNIINSGTYTLTITNTINGCDETSDVVVTQDIDSPIAAILTPTAIDCNNTSIVLDGSSSTGANLSYTWTPSGTTGATLNAAAAGTYTLTVLNQDNGCTDTEEVIVIDNTTTVSVTASVSNGLSCTQTSTTLDVSGGSGSSNPTYSWFDGTTTTTGPTLTTMIPGTYTVTLIDATTGCQGSTEVTVLQDTNFPTATVAAPNNLTCTTSSITLDGTGSTTGNNITYSWLFNGALIPGTNPLLSVANAGDYQIVVTDVDNGCEVISGIIPVILDNTPPVASAVAGNNGIISCSATSLIIDGSGSSTNGSCIEYQWILNGSVVGTNPTYEVTTPGDYVLEVIDCDNGCSVQEIVIISPDADLPNLTIDPIVNLDCNNSTTTLVGLGSSNTGGSVTVEWQDATGATVSPTDQFTTTTPGDYTFLVIDDGNGCSLSQLVTVLENTDSPLIDVSPAPVIDCANTIVTVNGTNSASGNNISYQWQDAMGVNLPGDETANTLVTGNSGDYILVVTNADNGCFSTQMVTVPENIEAPVFDASALNNIDCNNMEAQLTSSITSSFSTDLSYEWTLGATVIDTLATLSTSNEGVITVVVTDNQNGCTAEMDITVFDTTQDPTISASASSNGALDCITTETILDGTGSDVGANFNYSWTLDTDPTNILSTDLMHTTMDPGTYVLSISNTDNGCVSTTPVTITQSIAPPIAVVGASTNTLTCTFPETTLDGSGSSIGANFSYEWYDVTTLPGSPIAAQISFNVDVAGTYELVVTNTANGCTTVSNQIVIDQSSDAPAIVISNDGILTCANGDVLLDGLSSTAGGTITYEWIDANGTVTTGPELTVVTPGEVTLNITDLNNGCTSTDVFLVEQDVDTPVALTSAGGTLLCGQADLALDGSASSQNGNFTYEWWTFENGAPLVMVEPTEITYNVTVPGDYVIIVLNTDNGCSTISAPVTVGQDISVPTPSMTPSDLVLTCDIQTITFDASASTASAGSLIYVWTDINGDTLSNTESIDVSSTDEVTLVITDDTNGCSASQIYSTTQDVEEPSANAGPIQTLFCGITEVTLDGSNSSANGATITYAWYAPNDLINVVANTDAVNASVAGTWTLLITNTDNGCTSTSTVEVDQDITVPTVAVDFSGMLTCDVNEITVDGSASTTSGGGTLQYEWTGGSNTNTPTATFDTPGTYELMITDVLNNCTATQSFTIEEDELAPVADIQALTSSTISCTEPTLVFTGSASNNNGNPNGGTLTYEWFMDGMLVSTTTPDQVEITLPGDLELVVTNTNNGCTSTFLVPVDITDDVPNINIPNTSQPLTCIVDEVTIGANDNSVNPAENTYQWTTTTGTIVSGGTTLMPTVSATGTYTLTATNTISGCDISIPTQIVGDFDAPSAFASAIDQFDCVTFEITLDGTGSATGSTISYEWSTIAGVIESGATTINPVISAPGDYTLLVTDSGNGCASIVVVTVTADTDVPTIAGTQVIDPNCFGENNGSITLDNVLGGQLPYLYSIDGGALAPINQFGFLSAGEYDILVQDANGCETNQVISIIDPQELLVELGDNQTIGLGDEFELSAQIVGGYDTIMWSVNCPDSLCADQYELSIFPLNTVSYNVTVVDGNGCITTDQITISVEKGREVYIPNVFTPNGDGPNDYFMVYAGKEVAKVHEFKIFNRWGEQVFARQDFDPKEENTNDGWDGTFDNKRMNPAVFVYYVDIEFIDGRREILKGDVALRL